MGVIQSEFLMIFWEWVKFSGFKKKSGFLVFDADWGHMYCLG